MTEDMEIQSADGPQRCTENGWFSWLRWRPTSLRSLIKSEEKMMSVVKSKHQKEFVRLPNGNMIWTLMFNKEIEDKTPLVMVHGMAGGIGLFALNYDALVGKRPVYAFDLLGFGRSSHPNFEKDAIDSENQFVESIEQWRDSVGLNKMIILGHSFGGYLASSYALKYPERIEHLILADPWGFPAWKADDTRVRRIPWWARGLVKVLSPFNPLAAVRGSGPLGPRLIRLRGDLGEKFNDLSEEDDPSPVFDYIYHCNAQNPSGEVGFKNLTEKIGFALNPMIERIGGLKPGMPVSFVYGARTWMDSKCGNQTQELLPDNDVQVYSIKAAGHHVYADQPDNFHKVVNSICENIK
ncbi:(Lyso)-N-acylphosphatidylethanolamine lipase-like [Styela clava]